MAYIPQDASAALNPVHRAGRQIAEVFRLRYRLDDAAAMAQAVQLLAQVGIRRPEDTARRYPHELSGGMRQRVMIAMAIALRPALLVADEPTTALDVTVQAEIISLVRELQAEHRTTLLWITHDMGVVAEIADDVAVMYGGRIVEHSTARNVFTTPRHPYSQGAAVQLHLRPPGPAEDTVRDDQGLSPGRPDPARLPVPPPLPAGRGPVPHRSAAAARRRPGPPGGLPPGRGDSDA